MSKASGEPKLVIVADWLSEAHACSGKGHNSRASKSAGLTKAIGKVYTCTGAPHVMHDAARSLEVPVASMLMAAI